MNSIRRFNQKLFSEITIAPEILRTSYLPSLDGLRAFSIVIVIFSHLRDRYEYVLPKPLWQFFFAGNMGVYVFFCISGFLITTLLLKEKITTGDISLKKFYVRRILRIIPVSILYLVVLFFLNKILHLNIGYVAFGAAFFYIINIVSNSQWFTGHYWSLSVEEQFYIFFPFLIKRGGNAALITIFILEALLISFRFLFDHSALSNQLSFEIFRRLITNLDGVLIGSLTSILLFKKIINVDLLKRHNLLIKLFCILLIPLFCTNVIGIPTINSSIASVLICILILSCLIKTNDFIFKVLNWKPIKKIGVLSYSMYIFQQFFLVPPTEVLNKSRLRIPDPAVYKLPFVYLPYSLFCIVIVGYLSYTFYEKRFLSLKSRFK